MLHLPGRLFLTDPYQLRHKNTPCDTEAAGQETQGAPSARIRGSNSDDYEQDGKASRPGLECEEMKTFNIEQGYHTAQ